MNIFDRLPKLRFYTSKAVWNNHAVREVIIELLAQWPVILRVNEASKNNSHLIDLIEYFETLYDQIDQRIVFVFYYLMVASHYRQTGPSFVQSKHWETFARKFHASLRRYPFAQEAENITMKISFGRWLKVCLP